MVLNYINTELLCQKKKENNDNNVDITDAHIQAYVEYVKEPQDFPGLLHAITSYKRTRNYVMTTTTADRVITNVLESSSSSFPPNNNNSIEGPLWVLENFKERTGFYFSASTSAVNKALDALYETIQNSNDHALNNNDIDKERVWKALIRVTEGLIRRKTVLGGRGLKKRAKREYLRCLQTTGGPNQRTVRRVVEIGVMIKSVEETQKTLLQPYQTASVSIHPLTLERLLEEARPNEEKEENVVVDEEADESAEQDSANKPCDEKSNSPESEKEENSTESEKTE
jgi:hypothetical protein